MTSDFSLTFAHQAVASGASVAPNLLSDLSKAHFRWHYLTLSWMSKSYGIVQWDDQADADLQELGPIEPSATSASLNRPAC